MSDARIICEICGARQEPGLGWFLVCSEGGRDQVSVLRWDQRRARQPGMHSVCCAEHARELVSRWVFSGTLCCGAQGSRWHFDGPMAAAPADPGAACVFDPRSLDLSRLENAEPETLLAILDAVETALHGKWEQLDHDDHEVLLYDA